jgi:hypothetical protein
MFCRNPVLATLPIISPEVESKPVPENNNLITGRIIATERVLKIDKTIFNNSIKKINELYFLIIGKKK